MTTTYANEVAFIAGVNAQGILPLDAFWAWNSDTPATYTGGYTNSMKWGADTARTAGGTVYYYFNPSSNWNATEKTQLADGLALWSDVANITFAQTTNASQAGIEFTRGTDGSADTTPTSIKNEPSTAGETGGKIFLTFAKAVISIDTTTPNTGFGPIDGNFTTEGGYPTMTFLHEEGHALGLGHAGPYNGNVNAASQQFSAYDTRLYSIMSYIEPQDTSAKYYSQYAVKGTQWNDNDPTGLMEADLAAITSIYGVAVHTPLSGGQMFGFECNVAGPSEEFFDFTKNVNPILTLWDKGTNNWLNLDGYSTSSNVNLNAGTFSSFDGMVNNLCIANAVKIDNFIGGTGSDTVLGNADANKIYGGAGDDNINGGAGNDILTGGPGNDILNGGTGTDTASYADATGPVTVSLAITSAQNVGGGDGTDTLISIENLTGSSYNDTLTGNSGANVLNGGAGADTMIGGAGNDTYIVDDPGDVVIEAANGGTDTVETTLASYTLPANVENLVYIGAGSFTGSGNSLNNTITGGSGNDILFGGNGADTLTGGGGSDTFVYTAASQSSGAIRDNITDFDAASDKIQTPVTITGINTAITTGTLNTADFTAELTATVNAAHLAAHHAMEYTPNAGSYAGHHFLIIDLNGVAGYQANADLVIQLTNPLHMTSLGTSDFIT
jgi:Ca2+-binding RTX toxin-like protein